MTSVPAKLKKKKLPFFLSQKKPKDNKTFMFRAKIKENLGPLFDYVRGKILIYDTWKTKLLLFCFKKR